MFWVLICLTLILVSCETVPERSRIKIPDQPGKLQIENLVEQYPQLFIDKEGGRLPGSEEFYQQYAEQLLDFIKMIRLWEVWASGVQAIIQVYNEE